MNNKKGNQKENPIYNCIKKNSLSKNKFMQECKRPVLEKL